MENKHNFMETESITKLLIKFSIPAIVGMFVNALYNVVDRIYIGNIKDIGHLGIRCSISSSYFNICVFIIDWYRFSSSSIFKIRNER